MSDNYTLTEKVNFTADRQALSTMETFISRAKRISLGSAFAVMPARIGELPYLLAGMARDALSAKDDGFPNAENAEDRAQGYCGLCSELTVEKLIEGYRRGLFPFAHVGPFKWWSTPQRPVLAFADFRIEKKIRKLIRRGEFSYTLDQAFPDVVEACSGARDGKTPLTWLRPEMMALYNDAHKAGFCHSVEAWDANGALVGGAFGTAVGGLFIAESQFYRTPNASKCAYVVLNRYLKEWGFSLVDAKRGSPFMYQQGYKDMPRADYLAQVRKIADAKCGPSAWAVDPALDVAGWKPDQAA
ncbi:MAG: leucyl/phenylalanyl-tRNA--protein transferase [Alphaproteobacteria bacterium]|nr:leucyl/phenylalanyl-tRNA--protein transferase [Alphaproteobacteria bacterium]